MTQGVAKVDSSYFLEAVTRGAEWLDRERPGWERKVDLSTLDLSDSCRCVLGQIFAEEARHSCNNGFAYGQTLFSGPSRALGFNLPVDAIPHFSDKSRPAWRSLEEAWITLIKERFSTGLLSDEVRE